MLRPRNEKKGWLNMKKYTLTVYYTMNGRDWFVDNCDVRLNEDQDAVLWLYDWFQWKIARTRKHYPQYNMKLAEFSIIRGA